MISSIHAKTHREIETMPHHIFNHLINAFQQKFDANQVNLLNSPWASRSPKSVAYPCIQYLMNVESVISGHVVFQIHILANNIDIQT
jgi:hypothetical protein